MGVTTYTPDLAARVLELIEAGTTLREIEKDPAMPARNTLRAWVAADHDGFAGRFAAAREAAAMAWDEKAELVLLEAPADRDEIARAKELAQHYRWRASKIAPRTYGDRVEMNHTGTVTFAAALTEARQRRALLDASAAALGPVLDATPEPATAVPCPALPAADERS